jgi:hydrogenase 3 maturation protease
MGLGNVDQGDDGLGVRLAEIVAERLKGVPGAPEVIDAGMVPERFIGRVADGGFDSLVFLDAVAFGGAPGSVVVVNAEEMGNRFPQVSTHKISLGMLARWVEASGTTKAWLLGVEPESLKFGKGLTPAVQETLEILGELLCGLWCEEEESGEESPRPVDERLASRPLAEV